MIRTVSDIVNTQRIDFGSKWADMKDEKAQRLRNAREKAGFTSASEAAQTFGWGEAGYRHHENGTRGFGADAAKKYGRAFKVKPAYLMGMDDKPDVNVSVLKNPDLLIVEGTVAAGVWREADRGVATMYLEVPAPVPEAKRIGFTVEGHSMDLHYEPGTILDCVSIFFDGVSPEDGDHVIVERIKPDGLRELTVKEYSIRDGEYWLVPKSTKAEFKPIHIGKPDQGHIGDDEVRVIGFVVSAIPPRSLRLMERMGKVRRREN